MERRPSHLRAVSKISNVVPGNCASTVHVRKVVVLTPNALGDKFAEAMSVVKAVRRTMTVVTVSFVMPVAAKPVSVAMIPIVKRVRFVA